MIKELNKIYPTAKNTGSFKERRTQKQMQDKSRLKVCDYVKENVSRNKKLDELTFDIPQEEIDFHLANIERIRHTVSATESIFFREDIHAECKIHVDAFIDKLKEDGKYIEFIQIDEINESFKQKNKSREERYTKLNALMDAAKECNRQDLLDKATMTLYIIREEARKEAQAYVDENMQTEGVYKCVIVPPDLVQLASCYTRSEICSPFYHYSAIYTTINSFKKKNIKFSLYELFISYIPAGVEDTFNMPSMQGDDIEALTVVEDDKILSHPVSSMYNLHILFPLLKSYNFTIDEYATFIRLLDNKMSEDNITRELYISGLGYEFIKPRIRDNNILIPAWKFLGKELAGELETSIVSDIFNHEVRKGIIKKYQEDGMGDNTRPHTFLTRDSRIHKSLLKTDMPILLDNLIEYTKHLNSRFWNKEAFDLIIRARTEDVSEEMKIFAKEASENMYWVFEFGNYERYQNFAFVSTEDIGNSVMVYCVM